MRIAQQRQVIHRSRRRQQLHFDVLTRQSRAVAFTEFIVGVALGPGRHDDPVGRHAAQHHKGRARDGGGSYADCNCRPIVSQEVSGWHAALLLVTTFSTHIEMQDAHFPRS